MKHFFTRNDLYCKCFLASLGHIHRIWIHPWFPSSVVDMDPESVIRCPVCSWGASRAPLVLVGRVHYLGLGRIGRFTETDWRSELERYAVLLHGKDPEFQLLPFPTSLSELEERNMKTVYRVVTLIPIAPTSHPRPPPTDVPFRASSHRARVPCSVRRLGWVPLRIEMKCPLESSRAAAWRRRRPVLCPRSPSWVGWLCRRSWLSPSGW